jgi:hypothetical protein
MFIHYISAHNVGILHRGLTDFTIPKIRNGVHLMNYKGNYAFVLQDICKNKSFIAIDRPCVCYKLTSRLILNVTSQRMPFGYLSKYPGFGVWLWQKAEA